MNLCLLSKRVNFEPLIEDAGYAPEKIVCRADNTGCYSTIFGTYNMTFNKICGQAKGYQKGLTSAFITRSSINTFYVDGLSITLGNPRKHVWTYAIGMSVIFQIIIVPVLLILDVTHLLLLVTITIVKLVMEWCWLFFTLYKQTTMGWT